MRLKMALGKGRELRDRCTKGWMLLLAGASMAQTVAVAASFQPVDLAPLCAVAFSNAPSPQSWSALPRGTQTFGNVPFKIDGKLEVTGIDDARSGEFHPVRIPNIPIGRKAGRLHLLLGVEHDEKDGVPLAKLALHYANGEQRAVRLAYGIHARSWMPDRRETKRDLIDPDSRLAWTGNGDDPERPGASFRLYQTAVLNPLPGQEITSVEFVSLFSKATPFIAGLTTEAPGGEVAAVSASSIRRIVKKSLELEDSAYRDEFVIRASDNNTGQALPNAHAALTITDDQASFYFGEARADAEGVIRLPFPPQHTVAFTALVRAPGHIPYILSGASMNEGGLARAVEAKLARGVRIGGFVHDPGGKPVSDAVVTIYKVELTRSNEYTRIDHETVRTDTTGKWFSESTPAALERFSLHVEHPDYRATSYSVVSRAAGRPEPTPPTQLAISTSDLLSGKAVLALAPALRIAGKVSDGSGEALKEVDLRLVDMSRSEVVRSIPCDAQGRFSFVVPQPGELALMAQAKGFRPKLQPIVAEPDMKAITIALAKTQPLRGRVSDQSQEPIPGARVKLDSWNGSRLLQWQTVTDGKGSFAWESPPDGNVMFQISATNHNSMRTSLSNPSGDRTFTLRKLSRVFGRVIDAETRRPIDEFIIIKGHNYNEGEPIRWERYDSSRGRKGEYSVRLTEYSSSGRSQIMIEAPGYMPAASPQYATAGVYTNDFELRKGRGISGVVQLADGTPVANATVALVERSDNAYMERAGELRRSGSEGEFQRSNAKGEFQFSAKLEPHSIFAAHELGFAEARATNVAASGRVVLQPWGRIQGKLKVGRNIDPKHNVYLQAENWRYGMDGRNDAPLYLSVKAKLDAEGNFVFEKVPPGDRRVSLQFKVNERENGRTAISHSTPVTVAPNGTAEVTIGGSGRTVTGRMTIVGGEPEDVDWRRDAHTMQSVLQSPTTIAPPVIRGNMSEEERQKAYREYNARQNEYWTTPEGRALQRTQRSYALVFETNGTFRIENVEPGNYYLNISLTNPERPDNYYEHIGSLNKNVTIPPAPPGKPDEPFDLGMSEVPVRGLQRTGRRAPAFEVKTIDGKSVKLADLKGKYVLLDFWATWAGTRNLDLQMLKSLHTTYANDERLVILGLNFDNEAKTAEEAITKNAMKWPQSYLGPWNEARLPSLFGIQGLPDNVFIDSEGKIVGRNLRGSSIRNTVRNVLGDPKSTGKKP